MEDLLERSPSLRREVAREIERQTKHSAKLALRDLEQHGEIDAATAARVRGASYTDEQILATGFRPSRSRRHRARADVRRSGATFAARVPMFNERRATPQVSTA